MFISDDPKVGFASTEQDIIDAFEKVKKDNNITLNEWENVDYIARMAFFLENSDKIKMTASYNPTISDKRLGISNSAYKKIVTIPKNVENYIDLLGGDFKPVFRILSYNEGKAFRNDITVLIDFKNNIVWANCTTNKLVYGYGGKLIDDYCSGVVNYVIPNSKTLNRGKIKELRVNNLRSSALKPDFSDMEKFKDVIAKSVLSVARVDFDARHGNRFEDFPGINKAMLDCFQYYFKPCAEAPHFHFVSKGYVLGHENFDSAALAIGVNGLTRYLVDLYDFEKFDKLGRFDLGLPFLSIKQKTGDIEFGKVKDLTYGLRSTYVDMSDSGKETFKKNFVEGVSRMFYRLSKNRVSEEKINKFYNQANSIVSYVLSEDMPDKDEMIDPIILFAIESSAIGSMYNLPQPLSREKKNIGRLASDFYGTISYCLGKAEMGKERSTGEAAQEK